MNHLLNLLEYNLISFYPGTAEVYLFIHLSVFPLSILGHESAAQQFSGNAEYGFGEPDTGVHIKFRGRFNCIKGDKLSQFRSNYQSASKNSLAGALLRID